MRFYTRKKRTPQLILVSLIDILAILLIFFIVTTTFRRDQSRLQINLPESKSAETVVAGQSPPLVLRVKSAEEITLGSDSVSLESLTAALLTARNSSPDRQIAMQADREAPFGVVIKVLDALKQAGVKNVPTLTEPEPQHN